MRLVLSYLEVSECPGSLGMHNSLRDPLPVKVGELLDEDMILQHSSLSLVIGHYHPQIHLEQQRSPGSHAHTVELVSDGRAVAGGQAIHTLAHKLDKFHNIHSFPPHYLNYL